MIAKKIKDHNRKIVIDHTLDLFSREEQFNTAFHYVDDLEKLVFWWDSRNEELRLTMMLEF